MAPSTKRKFGQLASDYVPADTDGVWIRRFKDPSTQIRIAPATGVNEHGDKVYGPEAWPTEREHYDDQAGSFPCVQRFGEECIGCNDPSKEVRDRRRQYYVNALDDKGELRVFKFGATLYKTFLARHQRAVARTPENRQPLSDRDYIINRMGKGLDTTYDPEPGDPYDVDFPAELHDIPEILGEMYEKAERIYNGEEESDRPAPKKARDEDEEAAPARKTTAARRTGTGSVGQEKAAEPDPEEVTKLTRKSLDADVDAADTDVIKAFLDREDIEIPPRTPRAKLVKLAKDLLEPPF